MHIYPSRFPDIALSDRTITEAVLEGLALRGDRPAMIDGPSGRSLSGTQLAAMIKSLAGGLTARGHGAGKVVAVMAPNIPEYAAIFHAAAWAGGTITTINPTYTAEEVRFQLRDSGAGLLFVVAPFLETARKAAEGTAVQEIVVIGEAPGATPFRDLMGPPLAAQVPVDLDDHVVVMPYSSGTTGLPKGVMLTHRNLVANIDQVEMLAPDIVGQTTLAFLPFFHIYGQQVLMNGYLAVGGALVTLPRFDLEQTLKLIAEHRMERLFVVPPIVLALAKHPMADQFDLSSLRIVNSGAAPMGADLSNACAARIGCEVVQGYGMTELSPVSHTSPQGQGRPGASGVALPNTESRIVDPATGKDVAPGEDGELWVRGPQVMKGYLNNPTATAATLTADGWLKTGDIGHIDADGYLFLVDRVKELIKYKGFQVPPAELEALLVTHPGVADAAVIGVPDDEAGEIPMAYIVKAAGADPTLEELQAHLAGHVSPYKQIRRMAAIDAIPKSASGKILRRMLKAQVV